MNKLQSILKRLSIVSYPIRCNAVFFTFMYILGIMSEAFTTRRWESLYDNLFLEVFLDLYVVCLILSAFPRRARWYVRLVCYTIAYATAFTDLFCFVNYDSTLSPSILMLVGETDSREATEFLSTVISANTIFSAIGWEVLLLALNILFPIRNVIFRWIGRRSALVYLWIQTALGRFSMKGRPWMSLACVVLLVWSSISSAQNKYLQAEIFTYENIGDVEHALAIKPRPTFYSPEQRLVFSIFANHLASKQLGYLHKASLDAKVDSCDFTSPTIVLIIGESYGRHHNQLYGYPLETTPRQKNLERTGLLTRYTDVVTCWNLTSFVFKNVLSTHVVGQKGDWCDYPLFPQLFKESGYKVTFLTNQFLPKKKEAVYDFSGGFFLNDPMLSKMEFDLRNNSIYRYDEGLIEEYTKLRNAKQIILADDRYQPEKSTSEPKGKRGPQANLIIFHLLGQHVAYKDRYPRNRAHFYASTYEERRPELSFSKRKTISHYDNACLYNDSVVYQIVKRFSKQDAVVIYMPDHGEECYEPGRDFTCRLHSADIDKPLAHYEFEIPFWIYCSRRYIRRHPAMYRQIVEARHRRYMTDALPHLLMYLAGIHCRYYNPDYNILSPDYNEMRPRILRGSADYDKVMGAK